MLYTDTYEYDKEDHVEFLNSSYEGQKRDFYSDVSSITPLSFRNKQEKAIIDTCRHNGVKFTDPNFPPSIHSLLGNSGNPNPIRNLNHMKWARAEDIFGTGEFSIFKVLDPCNIRLGHFANSYFLTALSCLTESPGLITRLFDTKKINKEGLYVVWLNINGIWKEILLDDYFPVLDHGEALELATARTNEDDIWAMLLEKAYAKVYESYTSIMTGDTLNTLRDLTGGAIHRIEDFEDKETVWSQIQDFEEDESLMICYKNSNPNTFEKQELGIQPKICYSLLETKEVLDSQGRPSRILKIRNPWNYFNWNGDWSYESPLWTPYWREKLSVNFEEENEEKSFWISYEDFLRIFEGIGICKIEHSNLHNAIVIKASPFNQHTIRFDIFTGGKYEISLDQSDSRFFPEGSHSFSYFRMTIAELKKNKIVFIDCQLSPSRNICINQNFHPGNYLILVEAYWTENRPKKFTISCSGPGLVSIEQFGSNSSQFKRAEYFIWRNFAINHPERFQKAKSIALNNGIDNAKVLTSIYQDGNFGIMIYSFYNCSERVICVEMESVTKSQGFDVVSEYSDVNFHSMKINRNGYEVEIYKMDPRAVTFFTDKKIFSIKLHKKNLPADFGIIERLREMIPKKPSIARYGENILEESSSYYHKNDKSILEESFTKKESKIPNFGDLDYSLNTSKKENWNSYN